MPTGIGTALAVAGGGALIGGIAGAMKKTENQSSDSTVNAGSATALENQGSGMVSQNASQLNDLVQQGPGAADVSSSLDASHSLADMLQKYSQQGGANPNAQDISTSNNLAAQLFKAQHVQMAQNFQDQSWQANQQAALMGRSQNDPILRNKLAQEQTRQQQVLDAQQGGWATQNSMQQPMQRLGFASQRADVLGGLATQAMANRQAMVGMGSNIMGAERNFRLATASRSNQAQQQSGGGLAGALMGGLAGAGMGMGIAKGFGGGGGGGLTMGEGESPASYSSGTTFGPALPPGGMPSSGVQYGPQNAMFGGFNPFNRNA